MKTIRSKWIEAKLAAFRDITADCEIRGEGQNCLPFEKDICEFLGIPVPDFRKFNGGHNKKSPTSTNRKYA